MNEERRVSRLLRPSPRDPYPGRALATACLGVVSGASKALAPQIPNDSRLRADAINTPIVQAIEHIILKTFANYVWPRGILRAHIRDEMARERSTVGIASGCHTYVGN